MLKDVLPTFLVNNVSIYSILSKGIHELEEDECLVCFPIIKTGIELILDEKLVESQQKAKVQLAKKELSKLRQELKKR